jgi:hypothetical protein
MEAEGARRQQRLDAQHDSAARLGRETSLLGFIDRHEWSMLIIVMVLA